MKSKIITLIALVAIQFSAMAQNLNSYGYVVVPRSFEFLKKDNQYQLNDLTKFLFEKYGFQTYFAGDPNIPKDRCKGLEADVREDSGMFLTKIFFLLKNCQNEVVFTSAEGASREKDFKLAYQTAMRDAFKSLATLNYNYIPTSNTGEKSDAEEVIVSLYPSEKIPKTEKTVKVEKTNTVKKPEIVEVVAYPEVLQKDNTVQEKGIIESAKENKVEITEIVEHSMKNKSFSREGVEYFISVTEGGYNLFQKNMTEPFALLYKSSRGDEFIYSSVSQDGIGYFDEAGNLVIEILNKDSREPEVKVYKLQ